jgi:hypothetical protein
MATVTPSRDTDPPAWGRCWKCKYDLRGITSKCCPECGEPFELAEVLKTPESIRLMKPMRWPGRLAFPFACCALLLDLLLMPTPITLLFLALLWMIIVGFYLVKSWIRRRRLFRRFPHSVLIDPDVHTRSRIASIFLIFAVIIWSGLAQRAFILINPVHSFASDLYEKEPMFQIEATMPQSWRFCGVMPVRATSIGPSGVTIDVGFGEVEYGPNDTPKYKASGWDTYDETSASYAGNGLWIRRISWNFLGFHALNR